MHSIPRNRGTAREITLRRMLTAYPLACFTGAFLTDVTYVRSTQFMWADFSIWLITGGMMGGVLAAVSGVLGTVVRRRRGERRPFRWVYVLGTALMLVLGLVNAFVHSRDGWTSVVPGGITLSAVVGVLAIVTGWMLYSNTGEVR